MTTSPPTVEALAAGAAAARHRRGTLAERTHAVRPGESDVGGGGMAAGSRRRGALEQEVVAALAAAGRPLTVSEVLAELTGGLAYTTVMTALSRLHAKGALVREATGRAYAYSLAGDPSAVGPSVTARRMSRLLASDEDRAGVLARFVADLSPADEQLLTELLADGGPGVERASS